MSAKNRRSNYFIKKDFQARFIMKFCALIILSCFLMGTLVYFLSTRTITACFDNLHFVARSTSDCILPALALGALIAVVIVSLSCIAVIIFISHRIAGPLYHIERSVSLIAEGDLTASINLRRTDEIKAIAGGLNDMVKKFKTVVAGCEEEIGILEDAMITLRGELGNEGIPQEDIARLMNPFYIHLQRLKEGLSYFKVKDQGGGRN